MAQRIYLDVSNDIYETVLSFLNRFPKNKIKMRTEKTVQEQSGKDQDIFSKTSGLLKSHHIDPVAWQKKMRDEWDRA